MEWPEQYGKGESGKCKTRLHFQFTLVGLISTPPLPLPLVALPTRGNVTWESVRWEWEWKCEHSVCFDFLNLVPPSPTRGGVQGGKKRRKSHLGFLLQKLIVNLWRKYFVSSAHRPGKRRVENCRHFSDFPKDFQEGRAKCEKTKRFFRRCCIFVPWPAPVRTRTGRR